MKFMTCRPAASRCCQLALLLLVASLAAVGCAGPPTATDVSLRLNDNPAAPLAGILRVAADRPVTVSLEIDDGETVTAVAPVQAASAEIEMPVLGLLPDTLHTVTATITDERGRATRLEPLELQTQPLPEDFPPIRVPVRRPQAMEPGPTMIQVFRWIPDQPGEDDPDWGLAFAADAEGRVRWYYKQDFGFLEVRRMRTGNLLLFGEAGILFEVDMLGNVVASWSTRLAKEEDRYEGSIEVAVDTFHHDVLELPSGNFLALSTEARYFDSYPSEYPPGTAREACHVIGDVIAEFTREGDVVRQVKVLDLLDPERLGRGSLSTNFYEDEYEEVLDEPGRDWSHSNAIYYLEEEDAVVVSSNMQSAHYKVSLATGELEWILGDPTGWKEPWASLLLEPRGEVGWTYHQHGTERTQRGTWLVFDNGSERAIPPEPEMPPEDRYSRVVEFRIDDEARTVEQVWVYGPEQEWFLSPFISDADDLPETGNVLVTDGGRFADKDGNPVFTFGGRNWARVFEISHGDSPEKFWELVIDDPSRGYSIYRAQRFRSLYPSLDRPTG